MSTPPIDRSQYHILKKIRKYGQLSVDSLSTKQYSDCEYLRQQGFVSAIEKSNAINSGDVSQFYSEIVSYEITPSGRAAIYSFKATFYKWWIPVVISIASLLVSLFT